MERREFSANKLITSLHIDSNSSSTVDLYFSIICSSTSSKPPLKVLHEALLLPTTFL